MPSPGSYWNNRKRRAIGLPTIGNSEALTAKLRQLEVDRAALKAQIAANPGPLQIVPDVAKHVRQVIQTIESLPENPHRDDAIMDQARAALVGLLGDVIVIEELAGVFAELQLGRACITAGAEERT